MLQTFNELCDRSWRTAARLSLVVVATTALSANPSAAQNAQCTPVFTVRVAVPEFVLPAQQGYTSARVVETNGLGIFGAPELTITDNKIQFTEEQVTRLREIHRSSEGGARRLRLSSDGRPDCWVEYDPGTSTGQQQPVIQAGGATPNPTHPDRIQTANPNVTINEVPATQRLYYSGECEKAGGEWVADLYETRHRRALGNPRDLRRARFTAILVKPGAGPCYWSRPYGVTGDPIHVAVFTNERAAWEDARVAYTRCTLESATPAILVTTPLERVNAINQAAPERSHSIVAYQGRDCHNPDPEITLTSRLPTGQTGQTETVALQQYQTYRAGVQLGVLFANTHERTYGIQTATDTFPRIYDKGPVHNGPEYFASAVIYGLPHYIADLFGGEPYRGRDVVHERNIFDRVGGIFGIGLPDPRKRLALGLSFEVLPGFNITGTHNWYRTPRLTGDLAVGSVFRGGAENIPLRDVWRKDVTFGLSLDAIYFTSLLVKK